MGRIILHSDLNNFYASVECIAQPAYRDVPLAVAGSKELRHGVVLAKNAIAKKAGVKTGDVIREAEAKCPGIVIVPPHFDMYMEYSKRVFDIYTRFTPFVEPFGPDECWLDMSGSVKLFGDGDQMARKILATVKEETGLTVSVGVSFSKPLAKLCSDLADSDGYFVADESDYKAKLYPLDVAKLMNVGKHTAERLYSMRIRTIGQLALCSEERLSRALGLPGIKLRKSALGLDGESVRQYDKSRKIESVGHGMTTLRDLTKPSELYATICFLSDKIAARLFDGGKKCAGVGVDLRRSDLTHVSRQTTLMRATYSGTTIANAAFELAEKAAGEKFSLRTITVSTFDLTDASAGEQLTFFDDGAGKDDKLALALANIRKKYGKDVIRRALLEGTDFIYDKTDSEDFLPFKR